MNAQKERKTNWLTDTKMFTTTVWNRTGMSKVFHGFNHHTRAIDWIAAH
jgi:hypothetical protein